MKQSYYITPRTMKETTFWLGGEAIERPERKSSGMGGAWVFFIVLVLFAIGTVVAK
jgi:hypothetical protein